MIKLPKTLQQPELPHTLPSSAQWLAGEGAGSWFVIEETESGLHYKISRYAPDGNIECEGLFSSEKVVKLQKGFVITYPSHCQKVTMIYDKEKVSFYRLQ